jgi:16S rRNA (adenine1518-N6/adenine1519-N6)-dimethyltransferase
LTVKELLRRYGIHPSKGLGQSFLQEEWVLERILQASDLGPEDTVLEVGPGLGLMTRRLAEGSAAVVAVELDRKMLSVLAETLAGYPRAHIVQGDILQVDPVATITQALGLPSGHPLRYKVVANLPYYITSAALRHLLGAHPRPERLTVMVQREVAERIRAEPGNLSLLAISVQVYGTVELVCEVPARAFYPAPRVNSAVLRIDVHPQPRVPEQQMERFFRVVRAGFAQKRKKLRNSLAHNLGLRTEGVSAVLAGAGVSPHRRPETLSIEEWQRVAQDLPG